MSECSLRRGETRLKTAMPVRMPQEVIVRVGFEAIAKPRHATPKPYRIGRRAVVQKGTMSLSGSIPGLHQFSKAMGHNQKQASSIEGMYEASILNPR